ncbi:hypothetical protein Y032_0078g1218 [Ancylostoma ceylanicum]|uniref:Uncharacterized protein n=1 Tax=Ancylostoma ceylanicum TaxID=53326 RepID=A0A016TT15_9BILA|nr:hypothetical protein Y032_0078g1218 [Ancylostoma ceylanicum]
MGERTKPPISLSFASIRLNDLSDDYGFGDDGDTTVVDDDVVEEAQEASTGSCLQKHRYREESNQGLVCGKQTTTEPTLLRMLVIQH